MCILKQNKPLTSSPCFLPIPQTFPVNILILADKWMNVHVLEENEFCQYYTEAQTILHKVSLLKEKRQKEYAGEEKEAN